MFKLKDIFKRKAKGNIGIAGILISMLLIIVVLAFLPIINTSVLDTNANTAISYLEGKGYVILAAGEYSSFKVE